MFSRMNDRSFLLVLFVLVLLVRLPYTIEPFWIIDEAGYAAIANKMVDGGLLYKDGWDNKPPLIYYFYMWVFWLFGKSNMLAVHLAILPFVLAILGLIYGIALELFSRSVARFSAAAFAFFIGVSANAVVMAANTEFIWVPASCAGVYLALIGLRKRDHAWLWFASGCAFAVAGWAKQHGLLMAATIPVFIVIQVLSFRSFHRDSILTGLRHCLYAVAGFAVISGAAGLFLWSKGMGGDFLEAVVFYNTRIHVTSIPGWQAFRMALLSVCQHFQVFFVPLGLSLIGLGIAILGTVSARRKDLLQVSPFARSAFASLLAWFIIAYIAVSLGKRYYGHYFFTVAPCISLLIGLALECLRRQWTGLGRPLRSALIALLILGIVYPYLVFHSDYLDYSEILVKDQMGTSYAHQRSALVSPSMKRVATYIEKNTAGGDEVFVWGYQPQIYVISNRNFASRYPTVALQTGFVWGTIYQVAGWGYISSPEYWIYPGLDSFKFKPSDTAAMAMPGSMETLLGDLERKPPLLFVDGNVEAEWPFSDKYPISSFPEIQAFLDRDYSPEATIRGYRIYRRKSQAG